MKRHFKFLATILSCTLVMFSSCSDDDDLNELEKNQAKSMTIDASAHDKWVYVNLTDGKSETQTIDPIAGTYKGDVNVVVSGKNFGDVKDLNLKVARVAKDSISIVLKDFAFGKMKIDSIVSGAKVVVDSINGGLGYKLEGSQVITEVGSMTVKATSKGHIIGKDINLSIDVIPGGMPMPINATYTGKFESGVNIPTIEWDLAFHRMNVKTNGGSALETTFTKMEEVQGIQTGEFKEDEEFNEITVDMSQMMAGKIAYATDFINKVLGSWVSMKGMPPTFTVKDNVYVLKTSAGKQIKIKFTDYTNDEGKGGHVSFKYEALK